MKQTEALHNLRLKMEQVDKTSLKALVGFDGFVDQVVEVVNTRIDADHYERINYLADYGNKIVASAGMSMNIEMVPKQKKIGGNGPIYANTLIDYGTEVTYIGALGKSEIDGVFKPMSDRCVTYSISDPGYTDAVEFLDGKIISCKLDTLKEVSWENIKEKVGVDTLIELINESDLVSFVNWTLVVRSSDIWKHILEEVLPNVIERREKRMLFIDLADPEKRKPKDILEALELIQEFSKYFHVVLGLNYKESLEIAEILELTDCKSKTLQEVTHYIKGQLAIKAVVVHPVKGACAERDGELVEVEGPYCKEPKLTTGAGDNFNAGFILGLALGYTLQDALLMGVSSSGFYVRNARNATFEELASFVEQWADGTIDM